MKTTTGVVTLFIAARITALVACGIAFCAVLCILPIYLISAYTASTAMELFGSILGVGLCVFVMYHLRASCRQVIARFKNYRSTDGE